jgi:hypothetical protein
MYIGNNLQSGRSEVFHFTAAGGESAITTSSDGRSLLYTVGWCSVYLNGVRLHESDFTATTGNSITGLSPALSADDVVIVEAMHTFSVDSSVPATGGTFSGAVTVPTPTATGHATTKAYTDALKTNSTITTLGTVTAGTLGSGVNLKLARNEGLIVKYTAATTVDIDADYLTVFDSNSYGAILPAVNLTATITSSGVNGLDTGSEATNTWYHIYVIYNGTTVASLLSTSATSPTMPSGYTYKKYVGAVYNNGSSNFDLFQQRGDYVAIVRTQVVSTVVTSYATVEPVSVLPSTAVTCSGTLQANKNGNADSGEAFIASDSSGLGYQSVRYYDGEDKDRSIFGNFVSIVITTPQTIYFKSGNGGLSFSAQISGYTYANIV